MTETTGSITLTTESITKSSECVTCLQVHPSARLLYPTRIHTSIKSSLSRIPLLFCPSSSLAPSDLTSTVYVRAALTSNTNDADPISNALDPQPRFDDKKKGDTSRGPETETEYLSLGKYLFVEM
ncbi:hypothetical protein RHGRI_000004 [Rhododendron griersonianum]|uniref:Uncharacterized protein n=1 Tax=Rhododendron griersonianum TaxID=479676 RepID=A0AAV6L378_9ERIC|nr:hypothetical protein RHGRI_025362 [Rhododendron griersonianum]KAG5540941.1 hypothetical protein RHGRI_020987 [Rhododendron griersonianum]KAG5553605.1 hypothetical protein RHGRI_011484 [Rhododendron griersonianum]KAG5558813.1 hypothetical protein RHGRI_008692 [Rhododendron griersonianum]KAG5563659.1 hypothetical protein RHGRI_000004 [Rhododendron griersonianum]